MRRRTPGFPCGYRQQWVTMILCQHLVSRDDRQICLLGPLPKILSIKNGGLSRLLKFVHGIIVGDMFFLTEKVNFSQEHWKGHDSWLYSLTKSHPPHPTLHPQARLKTSCTTCALIYTLAIMFSLQMVIFDSIVCCCIGKYLPKKTFRFTFLVIYGPWSDQSILAECHPLLRVLTGVTVQILLSVSTQQWFYLAFSSF